MELHSNKQLKIGVMLSYLAIGLNILSGLIYTPWMLGQIGDSDYGLYTLATSIISVFTIDFGMSAAVSRFVSKYRAEKNQEQINSFLGVAYQVYLLADFVLLIAVAAAYFGVEHFATGLTVQEMPRFKIVFIMAATYSVLSFPFVSVNGVLNSYEKFIELKVCDMLNKVLTIVVTVFALLGGAGLYALVFINTAFNLLTIVAKLAIVKIKTPARIKFQKVQKERLGEIFGFSLWTTVVSISKRFLQNMMPVLLSRVCTTIQITIYGVGSVIEGYAYMMVSAITGMLMPRISRIVVGENRERELNALLCKVGRIQYFIIGLIFVGFATCGRQFVELCYSSSRINAYYVALFMIFPHLFYAPQQIAQTTVTVENKVMLQAIVHVLAAVVNVGLAYVLSKQYGAVGAAVSVCIVYLLRMLCMNVVYHKVLHLNMFRFYYECYIKMALPIIFTGMIGALINRFWTGTYAIRFLGLPAGWGNLVLKAAFIAVIYVIFMWFMGFNKDEKRMIGGIFAKFAFWKK